MKRKIVFIDEKKCNGCGLCADACHESAIEIIEGKARLISDEYCDGLGDCLPACPVDAIEIIEREAEEYNEEEVKRRMEEKSNKGSKKESAFMCPGTMEKMIKKETVVRPQAVKVKKVEKIEMKDETSFSELRQWPVQIKLINTKAQFLQGADLLIAADCTAYAYANFHKDFIKGRITMIGCPKLDDAEFYKEKFAEILRNNDIRSIKVIRMSVPCCGGIVNAVKGAMLQANTIVPYSEVTIDPSGNIVENM